jgi:hypothetical protein
VHNCCWWRGFWLKRARSAAVSAMRSWHPFQPLWQYVVPNIGCA